MTPPADAHNFRVCSYSAMLPYALEPCIVDLEDLILAGAPYKAARMRSLMVILLSCLPAVASFEVMAMLFDDSKRLEGKIILKVGDLDKINCPPSGKYVCMSWPTDLFKIDDICVRILGYYRLGFGDLRMIASDNKSAISAFAVERSGLSTKIGMYSLSVYECPDLF